MRKSYELAADDIVSVLYHNSTEAFNIRYKYNLLPKLMPEGMHQAFTEAVYKLYELDKPIHDTTIIDLAPSITPQWLAERVTLYDDSRIGAVVKHNVDIVRDEGLKIGTQRLLRIADGQLEEKGASERGNVVSRLTSALSTIGTDAKAEAVIATEHGKPNRLKDADSLDGHKIGIPYLDEITAGYELGHIWWIGGAYKARKTTLLLNMLLGAAMSDNSISPGFLSREMMQDRVQRQLESMLAIAWIYKKGYYNKTYKNQYGTEIHYNWIAPTTIKKANKAYARLDDNPRYEAYKNMLGDVRGHALYWAQVQYDKLKLRIYDSTPEHGNLSDYHSVEAAINMDMANYGGNWFGVDYLQLLNAPGSNLFEQVNFMAKGFQTLAQRKKVTMMVLAQLNEDTIKNGESYSPGVKGGGDPAQTADYFVRTRYNDDATSSPEELKIQMKLSRHGAGGQGVMQVVNIHPASGLILGQDWVEGLDA